MSIVRFNPFSDPVSLQREMNKLFENFFPAQRGSGNAEFESAVWRPMVDVHEDENSYVVDVELPGLNRENVKLSFEDGTLTISGERSYTYEQGRKENAGENGNGNGNVHEGPVPQSRPKSPSCHRMERMYGKFYRSFTFPSAVNPDNIQARFQDGILHITVPKAEEVKPRQIEIG